ncbi:phospholipase D [Wilcoxina mikolae CBS 423.85]|nr:phospholipase D [Wilcoxina mikolae CBS 423.85]
MRARRRRGGFFGGAENESTASVDDGGDEMDYAVGTSTPRSRRMRPSAEYSTGGEELETPVASKRPSLFQRLKSFGGNHGRSQSGWTVDTMDDVTPGPFTPGTPRPPYAASDGGIQVDEGAESEDLPNRRRSFSPAYGGTMSAPATPRIGNSRMRRRATTITTADDGNDTDRSRSRYGFSRRSSFRNRIAKRRSTEGGERPSYMPNYRDSAAKWNRLKANIRMIGKKQKEESKIDKEKSAELVAELSAATPAAVILASMFQRDEHGHRRIPILLEQLKVQITDSKHSQKGGGRSQTTFRLELEYGSGLTRMKWVIHREYRDFINLHSRYKLANISDTTFSGRGDHKLPKFPRSTIPYLRGVRGLGTDDESGDEEVQPTDAGTPGIQPHNKKKRPLTRRMSSTIDDLEHVTTTGVAAGMATLAGIGGASVQHAMARTGRDGFNIRQRQQLEDYVRRLIRQMVFRPDSNRLCKFLELSALGVRLAAEGSYHGKEGYLIIRSAKGSDFRRPWNPSQVARRHAPKWFLVRHSYIVCVDSPEEMNIYDVFLVDSNFGVDSKRSHRKKPADITPNPARPQHHRLTIKNHERTVKLLAKNERQLQQFQSSMDFMKENSLWSQPQRFSSFAPVRKGVFAQWLVDGRDYFWNVSRAISMAKDVIYIHDWWLSPELYLRRPAAVSQKWRLDRLLQKKAQEGVKIFVIVYRNIGAAIPIDSVYTKYSLLDLHPNIFVQRSPNQIRQNTFFWAHHEKILVVDHMIAFVGGIDLCFGRWDTPQHSIMDNKPSGFEEGSTQSDPDNFQLWPGKDYSNPRVQDFFNLDKPYEDMYDRSLVPRMPWHDIHMQIVGQPARDLTRHFVQRWNYLLRQRTPSRPTPLLLPPPDFSEGELESLGIDGSCEVQILRSACSWSLGTPNLTEKSIQNAYLKSIEMSEHLVYIENQFFITSTDVEGTRIENSIGDALVERIIRAHKNDEDWRAIIIIPLMPGFQNAIDAQDGTSVRLIMHCQFLSISQGENSIFGRLRAHDIEPSEYIEFYSLRNWGKLGKPGYEKLVTEQLYIHAKCMIVDDRIAIIGSANINERSMRGERDSEVAAIIRDTDTIMSTMAGNPFRVGRFPHTLRVRLMREHLGLDVDEIMQDEREEALENAEQQWEEQVKRWHEESPAAIVDDGARTNAAETLYTERRQKIDEEVIQRMEKLRSFNHDVDWEQENNPNLKANKKGSADPRVMNNEKHQEDVRGFGPDHMVQRETERASMSMERATLTSPKPSDKGRQRTCTNPSSKGKDTNSLASPISNTRSRSNSHVSLSPGEHLLPPYPTAGRSDSYAFGLPQLSQLPPLPNTSDIDIGGPFATVEPDIKSPASSQSAPPPLLPPDFMCPEVTPDMFADPLNEMFYLDIWSRIARNNTELYRQVFRCQPDNAVKSWASYKEAMDYLERFNQKQDQRNHERAVKLVGKDCEKPSSSGDGKDAAGIRLNLPDGDDEKSGLEAPRDPSFTRARGNSQSSRLNTATTTGSTNTPQPSGSRGSQDSKDKPQQLNGDSSHLQCNNVSYTANSNTNPNGLGHTSTRRRRRATTRSSKSGDVMEPDRAESTLSMIQGHLVQWPYDWLVREQEAGNWLYSIDQLAPIEI